MRFTKPFCLIVIVALVAHVSSVFGGAVLPTAGAGQHPAPPWVWHHDLVVAGQGVPLAAAPGPGNVTVNAFADTLANPAQPWHIEVELINPGPAVIPAGNNLVVTVPGAFWNFVMPAIPVGGKFQAVLGLGVGELQWAEVPEVGPWVATYTNNMAQPVDVDGGVSELETTPPHGAINATVGTAPSSVRIEFTSTAPIPTVSQWGLIILTLLLLTAATIIFARRRATTLRTA